LPLASTIAPLGRDHVGVFLRPGHKAALELLRRYLANASNKLRNRSFSTNEGC